MRKFLPIMIGCTVLLIAVSAQAKTSYMTSFRSTYNSAYKVTGSRLDTCDLCHPGGDTSARNSYANAYRGASHKFANIEGTDSDGDGFTNIQEIAALTFPGDISDKPPAATGSLTVTISPAGAVTAGALWRIGTGTYQNSGATVTGLAAGSVGINFKTVTGWTAPADQSVTITAGGTATTGGTYSQLSLVPNVVGQTQTAASAVVVSAGLTVGTVTEQYNATVLPGTVTGQSLPAGGYVTPGAAMALTVSKGPEPVIVPNVVGQAQTAASATITGAGLAVGTTTDEYSATVSAGIVINQTPVAGDSVPPGTAVALTVSKGVQPATVPNVLGHTRGDASTLIVGAGLVVGTVTEEYSSTVPFGTVIGQIPSGGESVPPASAVLLTVSKGVRPVITGSILINKGAYATSSTSVTLNLTWSSNAVRMRFSDNGATWTAWESLRATRAYTLPAGDGYKTVRVQFMDIANNRSVVYNDYIFLDTVAPTGSIIINNGALSTASASVTLKLTFSDIGSSVKYMRFSDDGATWTNWEPAAETRAYTLPGPVGYNTVRVQYRDIAGNNSVRFSDYIRLNAV